nr:tetratricopeptide repeat protein [Acidobacteriota bacterium]
MIPFPILLFLAASWETHYTQGRSLAQTGDWKRAETEFRLVVSERPGFLPGRLALGTVLEQADRWDAAESEFRSALLLDPKSTYALAQLAQSLMKLRHSSAAVPYWKQAIQLEPGDLTYPIGLAAALFESDDISGAQQILQDLATAHPDSALAHFSLGNLYARRGLFSEAADAYKSCVKIDPANDEARLALVKSLLALDRHNEALDALQGRREDFDTLLLRGAALRGLGEDGSAAADLAAAVRLKPDDYDTRYNLGFVLSRLGKNNEAKEQLERAAQLRPDSTEARYRLALVLKNLHENDRAEEELRRFERKKKEDLRRTISDSALTHNRRGLLLLAQGKTDDAEREFQAGLAADSRCAECQSNLGVLYGQRGDSQRAEELFRAALELNPRYEDARVNLGLMLAEKGRLADAEKELRTAAPSAKSLTGLGMVQTKLGKPEAVETFRRVVALDPKSAEARLNLGIALADGENLEGALSEFTEAIHLAPGDASAHYNRGRVLKDLGRLQEAAPEFEGAGSMPQALFLYAEVEQRLEHRDHAIALLRRAIAIEPGNARAYFLLGQNLQQAGKIAEAAAVWKQSL